MVSAVLLIKSDDPNIITEFHDQISNELPVILGKWKFEFKIFRNNPYSVPVNSTEKPVENKFLYTLQLSYLENKIITSVNNKPAILSSSVDESSSILDKATKHLEIPEDHLSKGATIGISDPFDHFVTQKLTSLWNFRQLIRGENGNSYQLENGLINIRTANCFLHGALKGFLIEIEYNDPSLHNESYETKMDKFKQIMNKYTLPEGKLSLSVLDEKSLHKFGDLCLQYTEVLNF